MAAGASGRRSLHKQRGCVSVESQGGAGREVQVGRDGVSYMKLRHAYKGGLGRCIIYLLVAEPAHASADWVLNNIEGIMAHWARSADLFASSVLRSA